GPPRSARSGQSHPSAPTGTSASASGGSPRSKWSRGSVPRSLRFGSSRVHGLGEALPRDPSVAGVAAVQEEQVRRGAPVGQALDLGAALRDVGRLATLLLPLVEGLGTGAHVRERGLENPRPRSWIVHLGPEHPCAVG